MQFIQRLQSGNRLLNTLTRRVALTAVAAIVGVSAFSRDADAQTRMAKGIIFEPAASWTISESDGGSFQPLVTYRSFATLLIECCNPIYNRNCVFRREDTNETIPATGANGLYIGSNSEFTGLKANDDGTLKRIPISLVASCVLHVGPGGSMYFNGSTNIRPARFTLTVTK
jgi:hypothetical protein